MFLIKNKKLLNDKTLLYFMTSMKNICPECGRNYVKSVGCPYCGYIYDVFDNLI